MNIIINNRTIVAFVFIIFQFFPKSSLGAIPEGCEQWLKNIGVEPDSRNCLMKCETSSVGMGTFDCPQYCKEFCLKGEDRCDKLKNMKPKACREMTDSDRKAILETADPKNFSRTRYHLGPAPGKSTEEETDCSTFVNEIYHRKGFDYDFTNTKNLDCVPTFQVVSESEAKPGDLILFDGHIGILTSDGQIISSTRGGKRKRSTLDPDNPRFIPSITKYKRSFFETKGKGKILEWHCLTK